MDEEELEFIGEEMFVAGDEIDMDYEFDAARFHDFTRAETDSEAREAERWFDSAGNYPPSPFIIKLNWRQGIPVRVVNTFFKSQAFEDVRANNNRGLNNYHSTQEMSQAKSKSSVTRSSTLMKPTASHLAKQNQFVQLIRLQKKLGNIDDKSSQNSSVTDDLATKRQKLETGYSNKEAQLKHKALMLHKVPKMVRLDGFSVNAKSKATIPREPDLRTAVRAERRRYKVTSESESIAYTGRVANKKILMASCFPITRRSKEQTSEFQKLSITGKFCISRNIKQASTTVTLTKVFPNDKRFQDEPPINQFSKLCLTSEAQKNTTPQRMEGTRDKNQENKDQRSIETANVKRKGFRTLLQTR